MKSCLQKATALATPFDRARQRRIHQRPSDAFILNRGIDGNRPDARNRGALIQTVATEICPPDSATTQ